MSPSGRPFLSTMTKHVMRLFGTLFHLLERARHELVRLDRLGRTRHHLADGDAQDVRPAPLEEDPLQIAVREDAGEPPVVVADDRHPQPLVEDLDERLLDGRCDSDVRHVRRAMHDVAHLEQEPPSERAAGMVLGEVGGSQAAHVEERDRERVAHHERGGRGRRRDHVVAACLLGHANVEHDVRPARERRFDIPGHRDDRRAEPLERGDERLEFVGRAALRDRDDGVLGAHDPQIAM